MGLGFFNFVFPGFAQGFVTKRFERAAHAVFEGPAGIQKFTHDAAPGDLRANRRPAVETHVARRQAGSAVGCCPPACGLVGVGGVVLQAPLAAFADPRTRVGHTQVVGLGVALKAVGAVVFDGALRVFTVPLKAVFVLFAAPCQGVFYLAMGAIGLVLHAHSGSSHAVFDVAQALDAGGGAADEFGEGGALKALVGQRPGVACFFNFPVKAVQLVQNSHGNGEAAKVASGLATAHLEHRAQELLLLQGVVFAFCHGQREHVTHGAHVAQHGFDLGFAKVVAVIIGGLPHGLIAAAVLGGVANHGEQALGIPETR